jgi:hypothetical protein
MPTRQAGLRYAPRPPRPARSPEPKYRVRGVIFSSRKRATSKPSSTTVEQNADGRQNDRKFVPSDSMSANAALRVGDQSQSLLRAFHKCSCRASQRGLLQTQRSISQGITLGLSTFTPQVTRRYNNVENCSRSKVTSVRRKGGIHDAGTIQITHRLCVVGGGGLDRRSVAGSSCPRTVSSSALHEYHRR